MKKKHRIKELENELKATEDPLNKCRYQRMVFTERIRALRDMLFDANEEIATLRQAFKAMSGVKSIIEDRVSKN